MKKLIINLEQKFASKNQLNFSDRKYIFNSIIDKIGISFPNNDIKPYFIHENVIYLLLLQAQKSDKLILDDKSEIIKNLDSLIEKLNITKSNRYIKYRVLGYKGYYPNIDIHRNSCDYTCFNLFPTIITLNNSAEHFYSNDSEVYWITRNELKLATSLMLTSSKGSIYFYFNDYNTYDIDYKVIENIPKGLTVWFLSELLFLQNRFTPINTFSGRELQADVSLYQFFDIKRDLTYFNKIFDSYSIRDQLLMRTSLYLIKSIMLWQNKNFGEDAIANVCFCLEGCLHLIQRKFGKGSIKLDLGFLKSIFINSFNHGDDLFDFISEVYDKRISIIHPEPRWGADWSPFLFADDFYEYFEICKELLNFILIERIIEY